MEPISPRGRALLELYRRESAPTPETLERARRAIALRLHSAPAPTQEPASHGPNLASLRPRRWWAWACGGAMVALGGLTLQHTMQPTSAPAASRRSPAVQSAPIAEPSATAHFQLPPLTSSASEQPLAAARLVPPAETRAAPSATRPGTPKRTLRNGEVTRASEPLTRSAAHEEQRTDARAVRSADHPDRPSPDIGSAPNVESSTRDVASEPESDDRSAAKIADTVSTTARPADARTLDAEVMQLRTAFDLLQGGEPLRALSALGEHARRFPAGKLRELADVARVLALCDLGRVEAARGAADEFLVEHPRSIHAPRVRSVCRAAP